MGEPFNAHINIRKGSIEFDSVLASSNVILSVGVGERDLEKSIDVNKDGYLQ